MMETLNYDILLSIVHSNSLTFIYEATKGNCETRSQYNNWTQYSRLYIKSTPINHISCKNVGHFSLLLLVSNIFVIKTRSHKILKIIYFKNPLIPLQVSQKIIKNIKWACIWVNKVHHPMIMVTFRPFLHE